MLATKKQPTPKLELISSEPGLSEFEFFLQKAQSSPGKLIIFAWWTKSRSERYTVKLLYKYDQQTLWQVLKEYGNSTSVVWEHACNDVLLVYNLIAETCGLPRQEHAIDGMLTVNGAQKDIARSSFLNAICAIDALHNKSEQRELAMTMKAAIPIIFQSKNKEQLAALPVSNTSHSNDQFQKRAAESRTCALGLLTDWTSGLYNYGTFIILLDQEFQRAFRAKTSMTLVVVRLAYSSLNQLVRLPASAEAEAIKHLSKVKRQVDTLGHFDDDRLAVILPQAKKEGAKRFINRLIKSLNAADLGSGINKSNLYVSVGFTTAPADCCTVAGLLESAHNAQVDSPFFPVNQQSALEEINVRIA